VLVVAELAVDLELEDLDLAGVLPHPASALAPITASVPW
jgi:hypothetical protein